MSPLHKLKATEARPWAQVEAFQTFIQNFAQPQKILPNISTSLRRWLYFTTLFYTCSCLPCGGSCLVFNAYTHTHITHHTLTITYCLRTPCCMNLFYIKILALCVCLFVSLLVTGPCDNHTHVRLSGWQYSCKLASQYLLMMKERWGAFLCAGYTVVWSKKGGFEWTIITAKA